MSRNKFSKKNVSTVFSKKKCWSKETVLLKNNSCPFFVVVKITPINPDGEGAAAEGAVLSTFYVLENW